MKVLKFGGTSVGSAQRIKEVEDPSGTGNPGSFPVRPRGRGHQ